MASSTDYGDFVAGKLAARLAAGVTSGATVTAQTINGSPITWPTGAHRVKLVRETRTGVEVETVAVASASQSGNTVTLGTLTRQLSLTSGSSFSSGGDGRTFPANTRVYLTWDVFDAELTPKTDIANTFSAAQTVTAPLTVSGTTSYIKFPSLTTTQRNALSASNGMVVYDSSLGQFYKYEGGAWAAVATGTFSDAADHTAGKVDLASLSEAAAGTANDATSGAPNVIPVSLLKQSSTGAAQGNVVALNASTQVDSTLLPTIPVTKGGTNLATLTSNALIVGAGTSSVTFISPGIAGTTLVSGGTTATFKSPPALQSTSASSSATTSNTSENTIDQKYTIPANSVAAGDVFHLLACGTQSSGVSPTVTFRVKMGSTTIVSMSQGTANGDPWIVDAWITVRSTGASGTVVCLATHCRDGQTAITPKVVSSPVTIDFTATQDLQLSAQGSGNVSVTATQFIVHKLGL